MIVNRTPHLIRVYRLDGPDFVDDLADGLIQEIPPTGPPVRLAMIDLGTQGHRDGVPIELVEFGRAHDLPPKQDGVQLIVPLVVALACHGRNDLLFPYREVRNTEGTAVGCRQFGQGLLSRRQGLAAHYNLFESMTSARDTYIDPPSAPSTFRTPESALVTVPVFVPKPSLCQVTAHRVPGHGSTTA